MTMTDTKTGELADAIASGSVIVNTRMTPEQERTFASQVEFFDGVIARGMARVDAQRRDLISRGLMTEDGRLIDPPALP